MPNDAELLERITRITAHLAHVRERIAKDRSEAREARSMKGMVWPSDWLEEIAVHYDRLAGGDEPLEKKLSVELRELAALLDSTQ